MGRFFFRVLFVACLSGLLAGASQSAAAAPGPADLAAMRRVIEAQLQAIARDDGEAAFSFASPAIRERFGNARAFLAMVRREYAAVYRPSAVSFLDPRTEGGLTVYPVQLADREGRVWLALYSMQRLGRDWRISGCVLLAADATAV